MLTLATSMSQQRRRSRAYSLVEVLAALVIFLTGIVAILNYFPNVLRAEDEAILETKAAFLAQLKANEVRRDRLSSGTDLVQEIRLRREPTEPLRFPREPRLAYAFSGASLLDRVDDLDDPTDDRDIARVIVFKVEQGILPPAAQADAWNILYELRFE